MQPAFASRGRHAAEEGHWRALAEVNARRGALVDSLAFLSAKALWSLKSDCESAPNVGLGLGLMLGTDEILKYGNVETIFGPFLGGMLKNIFTRGC
jgi:hypothetical protein